MPDPLLDSLGALLKATSRLKQKAPLRPIGPEVSEQEDVIYQPGPPVSAQQLVPLVSKPRVLPGRGAGLMSPLGAPLSDVSGLSSSAIYGIQPKMRRTEALAPSPSDVPGAAESAELGAWGRPDITQAVLAGREERARPLRPGEVAEEGRGTKGFIESALEETILKGDVAEWATKESVLAEEALQRKYDRINVILAKPTSKWSTAEHQFMIDESPPGYLGDSFKQISGDDQANRLRNREQLRKAIVIQRNPWLQSVVEGTSLRHIWMGRIDDLKKTMESCMRRSAYSITILVMTIQTKKGTQEPRLGAGFFYRRMGKMLLEKTLPERKSFPERRQKG